MTPKAKILLGTLAIAALGLSLAGGQAKAASKAPKLPDGSPDFAKLAAEAIATRDPAHIRKVAAQLKKQGYAGADDLVVVARELELKAQGTPTLKKTPGVKPETKTKTTEKARLEALLKTRQAQAAKERAKEKIATAAASGADDDKQAARDAVAAAKRDKEAAEAAAKEAKALELKRAEERQAAAMRAATLAAHLSKKPRGSEDQRLVIRFQEAEGLVKDGRYGPKTAAEIASYGVVPPTPFYWPADFMQAKKDYRAVLVAAAQDYPAKSGEFLAAAKKVV